MNPVLSRCDRPSVGTNCVTAQRGESGPQSGENPHSPDIEVTHSRGEASPTLTEADDEQSPLSLDDGTVKERSPRGRPDLTGQSTSPYARAAGFFSLVR